MKVSRVSPHCGVLAARPARVAQLAPDELLPSSDATPERFELGTLPDELLAGTTATVDFIAGLDPAASGSRRKRIVASLTTAEWHERQLCDPLEQDLASVPGLVVHGHATVYRVMVTL